MRWASPGEATPTVNGAPRKDSSNLSVHTPAFGNGTSIVSAEPLKFRITMAYSSGPAGPAGPWRRIAAKTSARYDWLLYVEDSQSRPAPHGRRISTAPRGEPNKAAA